MEAESTSSTGPVPSTESLSTSGPIPSIGQQPSAESVTTAVPVPAAEPVPSASKRKQLSRDQRLQIHTLRRAGHTVEFIVEFFKPEKVTYRQVYYACTQPIESQKHRCGAKPKLDESTRHRIKELITQSAGGRPMTYREVAKELQLDVSENTIARALAKVGYHHTNHNRISKNYAKKNDRERQMLVKQIDQVFSQTVPSDTVPSPNTHTPVGTTTTSWAPSPENSTASSGNQSKEPSVVDMSPQMSFGMSSDSCTSRH